MAVGNVLTQRGSSKALLAGAVLVTLSISVGTVVGNPGVSGLPVLFIGLVAFAGALFASQTFAGFLVLAGSCFIVPVVAVTADRYLNPFDLLLPFMLPTALYGSLRQNAERQSELTETGPAHARIDEATRRFTRAVVVYYAMCAVSLIPLGIRIGAYPALNSGLMLIRAIEGLLLFPLALWWLRSERRVDRVYGAITFSVLLLAAVSLTQRILFAPPRAGMTWVLNQPGMPTEDPNPAGLTMVLLMAFVFAYHALRPRLVNYFLIVGALIVLVLSQSRSGILAMLVFLGLNSRRIKIRYVLLAVVLVGLAVLVVPEDFRSRIVKTVTLRRGSGELFSFLIRVFGYISYWRAFLDNWLFGLGYAGGMYVSHNYNELKIAGLAVDNYYLETAVGLGVIGLTALIVCFVRLFQLGRVVLEVAAPGTIGHRLARMHVPLVVAILVACLTGGNLLGMVTIAQLSLWCAMLVRAGHQAVPAPRAAGPR